MHNKLLIKLEELERRVDLIVEWMEAFTAETEGTGDDEEAEEENLTGCRRVVRTGREL